MKKRISESIADAWGVPKEVTPMGIVRVFGNGLSIDRIRLEDILISGQFKQIEYEI